MRGEQPRNVEPQDCDDVRHWNLRSESGVGVIDGSGQVTYLEGEHIETMSAGGVHIAGSIDDLKGKGALGGWSPCDRDTPDAS